MKPRPVIVPTLAAVADAYRNLLYKAACDMWAKRTADLFHKPRK